MCVRNCASFCGSGFARNPDRPSTSANWNGSAFEYRTTDELTAPGKSRRVSRMGLDSLMVSARMAVACGPTVNIVLVGERTTHALRRIVERPTSASVSSTGCKSNVERLITLSTSAVAVCCCSGFAQLVEQPRVLDGDHRLRGEVLHQLDLLVGERLHLLAIDDDCTDQRSLP